MPTDGVASTGADAMGVRAVDDRSSTENDDDRTRASTERARRPNARVVVRRSVPSIHSFIHSFIPRVVSRLNPKPSTLNPPPTDRYFRSVGRSVGRSPRATRRDATRGHTVASHWVSHAHTANRSSVNLSFTHHPRGSNARRRHATRRRRDARARGSSRVRGAGAIAARARRNDARARHGARRARGRSVEEKNAREGDREGEGDDDRGRRSFRETQSRGGRLRTSGFPSEWEIDRARRRRADAGEVVQRDEGVRVHRPG